MALELVTDSGVQTIPGAVVQTTVAQGVGGLGLTGVVALVGESTQGPDYSAETDLVDDVAFGPDQLSDVQAKYGSGPLVDGFKEAVAAANDPDIQGSPAQIFLLKTNAGSKASGTLPNWSSGTWATLRAKKPGQIGSLIQRTVTAATSEVLPTTGAFDMLVPTVNTDINFRVNGGAAIAYTINAGDLPSATQAGIDALSGVACSGGADRGTIGAASGTLAIAVVSGNQVTFTRSVNWTVTPTVGDVVFVSSTSVIAGGSSQNCGSYVVTAATGTTISATKLRDATGAHNALTAPVNVGAQNIASTTADLRAFAPITITLEAGNPSDGLGKSLEIAELTSSGGRLSDIAFLKGTTTVATWISKSGAAAVLASATEYSADLNVARQLDGINQDIVAGGDVLLTLGYAGTTASAVIANNVMTITVAAGSGASLGALDLTHFATIADLAAYIATFTGYSAAPGTAAAGSHASTELDAGTFTFASTFGANVGRIKGDAFAMVQAIGNNSNVELATPLPTAGLPEPATATFLTGGTKGATSDANIEGALEALEDLDVNFVVTLFSNDAAVDIADGLTDGSSTYTIAAVNANLRSHCLKTNTLDNYRPRQGFASFRGTFDAAKAAASNLAQPLVACTFEDVRTTSTTGSVVQQRPWMGGVKGAGMQAAAFRKGIFNKGVNVVGAIQAAGDFNFRKNSQITAALKAGLLPLVPRNGGGWKFVSDQTTYVKDDNFFYNSIQAIYVGNVMGRTLKQNMEDQIVGQNVADLGRSQILVMFRRQLDQFLDLKLTAPSDGAPKGYRNETVVVAPPAVFLAVELFEATCLYFVKISLKINSVVQS